MILKLALGVALGALIIFAGRIAITSYAIGKMTEATNEAIAHQQAKTEQQRKLRHEAERREKEQMRIAKATGRKNKVLFLSKVAILGLPFICVLTWTFRSRVD